MKNFNLNRYRSVWPLFAKFFFLLLFGAMVGRAADRYVVEPGTIDSDKSALPYNTWTNAATNIQWAVNAATNADTVWVSNGTYNLTNQIVVTNAITLQSVNGRDFTFINGNYPAYSNMCLYLSDTNGNAIVDGFTMFNGYAANGIGGVSMGGGTLQNCHIRGNFGRWGGGVSMFNTSSFVTQNIFNCIINSNWTGADGYFGGANFESYHYSTYCGIVSNCVISYNTAVRADCPGGVTVAQKPIFNSEISYNNGYIGGIVSGWYSTIVGCKIIGNTGTTCGGVNLTWGYTWVLRNCLIYNNHATTGGGGVVILQGLPYIINQLLQNCTIVSNSTESSTNAGGIYCYGNGITNDNVLFYNSIVYFNSSGGVYSNVYNNGASNIVVQNCCLGMTNGALSPSTNLNNIIYANPLLVDLSAANCRLTPNSPCVNTGANQEWMNNAVDLDGRKRIMEHIVDMGAYEFLHEGTIFYGR